MHKPNYILTKLCTQFTTYLNTDPALQKPNNNYLTTLQRAAYVKGLPCMKLLPKVHKLEQVASSSNLNKLTRRPIITAYSWINPIHCDFIYLALNWKTSFLYKKRFFKNET